MISREDLRNYAGEMLNLLEMEKINSVEGLCKKLGCSFQAHDGIINFELRPSGTGFTADSTAVTISYIINGKGIPLELRLNQDRNYALMVVKTDSKLKEYEQDFLDFDGNRIQSKRFELSFDKIKSEIEQLYR